MCLYNYYIIFNYIIITCPMRMLMMRSNRNNNIIYIMMHQLQWMVGRWVQGYFHKLHRFKFKVFGDLLQRFIFSFWQTKVEVHEPDDPYAAKQNERVIEADKLLKVHVELGHEEAEEEIHRGTNTATQVFTSGNKNSKYTLVKQVHYKNCKV